MSQVTIYCECEREFVDPIRYEIHVCNDSSRIVRFVKEWWRLRRVDRLDRVMALLQHSDDRGLYTELSRIVEEHEELRRRVM